jgi:hypothetical protein
MGGLGNQLFQIFTTISYALQSQNQFNFLNVNSLGSGSTTVRPTYWNNFLSKLQPFLLQEHELPNTEIIRENGFHYRPIPVTLFLNKNVSLFGYFQSYRYFQEYFQTICKIIDLEAIKVQLLQKLNYDNSFFNNTVSMHFRIGDYKKIQDFHPLMPEKYYEDCLNKIQNSTISDKTVIYFCEDVDIEEVNVIIENFKTKFPKYVFIRADNELSDWEQMLLMSCCRYNIIANSSFSWWGAYLNNHSKKMVFYPSVWFGKKVNNNVDDLFPDEWTRIKVKI